ncbi:MAG TPA: MmgE/PrpD family protein [Steroidobacteraceae bacterium]|nr:MmgE/PrpD family protein [Steroidobacteraceae bacterium]
MSLVVDVADYAAHYAIESEPILGAARHCLIDALACGFESLREAECAALVGPLVPGALMPGGARIPGTSLELDPAQAAFCLSVMLARSPGGEDWLELPSVCGAASLAAVLATADYLARKATMEGKSPPTVRDLLAAAVKALEIQAVLAPAGGESRPGTAAVRCARIAATAVAAAQLGGTRAQIVTALGYAALDGALSAEIEPLCQSARMRWASAEAMSLAVRHACQATASRGIAPAASSEEEAADRMERFLGAARTRRSQGFGTEFLARLARRRGPQEIERLAMRFRFAVEGHFPARQAERIRILFATPERIDALPVNELLAALVTNGAR